jgi:predicted nucleic acid-binding protein
MTDALERFLLDADAFIQLYSLGVFVLPQLQHASSLSLALTEYVARHELSSLGQVTSALEARRLLVIQQVSSRDPNWKRLKQEGVDKGEAEAIAWALGEPAQKRPIFVSVDARARKTAMEHGLRTADLLDFTLALIDAGVISESDARTLLAPWEDRRQQRGRPKDFTTFDETVPRRRR